MITLIVGPDNRSAREAMHAAIDASDPERLNTTVLDGRSLTTEAAVAAVSSPGFFGATRVIVVDDLMQRGRRGSTDDEAGADQDGLPVARPMRHFAMAGTRRSDSAASAARSPLM